MKPGDKVICINDEFPYGVGPQGLVAGAEYTIAWRGKWNHPIDGSYMGVRLVELQRGKDPAAYCDDLPFRADRFKPVVSGVRDKEMEVEHG